jgi:hypothetical protein
MADRMTDERLNALTLHAAVHYGLPVEGVAELLAALRAERDECERLREEDASYAADYRGAVMVLWCLLQRLGGRATLTSADLLDAEHEMVEVDNDPISGGRTYRALLRDYGGGE